MQKSDRVVGRCRTNAPAYDEIEVSLFGGGGGIGECIIVHVGNNQWIIVDSFLSKHPKQLGSNPLGGNPLGGNPPVATKYLQSLGVNMAKDVKLIIASHWHNDHIKGIAKVYQDSLSADFVISDALKADEFGTLLQIDQSISAKKRALGELNQVLSTAYEKDNLIKLAISDRLIWSGSVDNQKCHVYCLSPSDASVQLARQEIAQIVNGFNSANRQIIDVNPNHNSVVLRIEIEDKNILLGSDLENTGDSNTGWSAVMRTNFKPMQNASVYKVPHHGSETSYAPEIWSSLLVPVPFAILTPFKQGKVRLPQKAYAEKISEHTEHAYITSDPNLKAKAKNRDYKVEKTIKQLGYSPVELSYPDGHIRLRSKINEQVWHLKLFGSAIHLKECNWQP